MAHVRVRQHVNPLSQKYRTAIDPPDWLQIYAVAERPLHVDLGCARGNFLLDIAHAQPDWNFLGLEIREPLVMEANHRCQELGLTNLHFLFCNIGNSLAPLLASLPAGALQRVSIQFPDPWFKQRHRKRRLVQPELVEVLAEYLPVGGVIFAQSDVELVMEEICDRIQAHPAFQRQGEGTWLAENPLAVPSDREQATLVRGAPVYRALFRRIEMG